MMIDEIEEHLLFNRVFVYKFFSVSIPFVKTNNKMWLMLNGVSHR